MPKKNLDKVLSLIKDNHPEIQLVSKPYIFSWSPTNSTISYDPREENSPQLVLHELGHALKRHSNYTTDISLLKMEREAWTEAEQMAESLHIELDDELTESSLDSYRDWIHQKSTCPTCSATGFQKSQNLYSCPVCTRSWQVNDGILCRIYRKKLN